MGYHKNDHHKMYRNGSKIKRNNHINAITTAIEINERNTIHFEEKIIYEFLGFRPISLQFAEETSTKITRVSSLFWCYSNVIRNIVIRS